MSESEINPELKKLIETVIQKVDGLAVDVSIFTYKVELMEARFDRLDAKLDKVEAKLDQIDARLGQVQSDLNRLRIDERTQTVQFNEVGVMAINDNQRKVTLEQRVGVLEEGVH